MQHFARPECRHVRNEILQAGQETRVTHQLRRGDVIGMTSLSRLCDHDRWTMAADGANHSFARLRCVDQMCVREPKVLTHRHAENTRRFLRLGRPDLDRAAAAGFTRCQIHDAHTTAQCNAGEECAAAGQFHIVRMRHDGEDVKLCGHPSKIVAGRGTAASIRRQRRS